MAVVTLREKGQVTLPADVREAARLEAGDPILVEIIEEGILLRPQKVIDATQSWFWSEAWQRREREADADLAAKRFERFESDEALVAEFEAGLKPQDADL
jgi:antitoxin PrlF